MTKNELKKEISRLEQQIETARRCGDQEEVQSLSVWLRALEWEMGQKEEKKV
jgi:hypothetical protein